MPFAVCEFPGCRDLASRKAPTLLARRGRQCCVFRSFCAAHVPASTRYTAPTPVTLPTHQNPAGQIHVPRVWEITGRADRDRHRAVAEWNRRYQILHPSHA